MFNVPNPNEALITLFVTQFNVVKDIYLSKMAGGSLPIVQGRSNTHTYIYMCVCVSAKEKLSNIMSYINVVNNNRTKCRKTG